MNISIPSENQDSPLTQPNERIGLAVLGMHRSGTSALTRVLSLLGAELPQRLMGANYANETGYWEPQKLVEINDQVLSGGRSSWDDWRKFDALALSEQLPHFKDALAACLQEDFGESNLFVLKDPRICRLVPLFKDVLDQLRVDLRFVIPYRNAISVAASLNARDGMSVAYAKLLWARHILDAEADTRVSRRVFISYDRLLSDFEGVCDRVGSLLNVVWPISMDDARANIAAFIRSDLRHHHVSAGDSSSLDEIDIFLNKILANIDQLERDPHDEQAMKSLSSLREELDNPCGRFLDATFDEFAARQARDAETFRLKVGQIQQDAAAKSVQLAQAQQDIAQKEAQRVHALQDADVKSEELRQTQAALEAANVKIKQFKEQHSRLSTDLAASEARADLLETGLNEILSSYSWRVTRLMRVLGGLLRKPVAGSPR